MPPPTPTPGRRESISSSTSFSSVQTGLYWLYLLSSIIILKVQTGNISVSSVQFGSVYFREVYYLDEL